MTGRRPKHPDDIKRRHRAYPYESVNGLKELGVEPSEFPALIRRLLKEHKDKLKQQAPTSKEG